MLALVTKSVVLSLALVAATLSGSALANGGPSLWLECNEEFSEGKHCGIELKCYDDDVQGEFAASFGDLPEPYFSYGFFIEYANAQEMLLCGTEYIVGNVYFKQEHKCTENSKGRDEEGDVAAELIIDLTGCPFLNGD